MLSGAFWAPFKVSEWGIIQAPFTELSLNTPPLQKKSGGACPPGSNIQLFLNHDREVKLGFETGLTGFEILLYLSYLINLFM